MARKELVAADESQAEATDALRAIEQAAVSRAATRDHIFYERANLVARVEAPVVDTGRLRDALEAFDRETEIGEPDLTARELAREWLEVDGELARIEDALPPPPTDEELAAAEHRLDQIERTIVQLESAGRRGAAGHRDGAGGAPRPHLPRGRRPVGLRSRSQRGRAALRPPRGAGRPDPGPGRRAGLVRRCPGGCLCARGGGQLAGRAGPRAGRPRRLPPRDR